ncbi:MAG: hypothetical protein J7M40_00240 [Planctomycetes bacterium]|nr:hypothetical protein [Planctomycetota bacterium]
MATNGDLDRWATSFPASLVPQIIKLVLDSWKKFKTSQTHEVSITQEFFVLLNSNQESSRLPFLIDLEVILPNADGTRQKGRLDIRFIHGYRRKVYFSLECKRLRVSPPSGFKSLANEYVTEGMFRYFNGQYAAGLDKGGMLAYVMDGKIDVAIDDVSRAIEKRCLDLNMGAEETLRRSSCLSSTEVRETRHNYGLSGEFVVYHVFVKCGVN